MEAKTDNREPATAESEMTIGSIKFHVKSVFEGKVKLEDALENIAIRKQKDGSLPIAV